LSDDEFSIQEQTGFWCDSVQLGPKIKTLQFMSVFRGGVYLFLGDFVVSAMAGPNPIGEMYT
jgi:hypothetical protein